MRHAWVTFLLLAAACGPESVADAGADAAEACEPTSLAVGDPDGHPAPLDVGPGEARAGRVTAEQLPDFPSGLQVWEGGDFVLANEHVAMVIEDADHSELYDPWGGRPVGVARVEGGALVEPGDFGEILLLMGRMTVLTQRVTVLNDGSDGEAAVVRAEGVPRPMPFFESVVGTILQGDFEQHAVAIDYVLEPGARHVDVFFELTSDAETARSTTTMHAFMHTPRMPPFAPGVGFDVEGATVPWVGLADEAGTSFAYRSPTQELGGGLEISGFVSFFTRGFAAPACETTRRHHAQIVIGGPGVDGLVRAVLHTDGVASRELTGIARDASGAPAADVWVLAEDDAGFVSRTRSAEDGRWQLEVPADADVALSLFRRGDRPSAPVSVGPTDTEVDLALPEGGWIHVVATAADGGAPLPVRVQLLPAAGADAPAVSEAFGIPSIPRGRFDVAYPIDGDVTLRAPAETVRVVVSRGYEYEVVERPVEVTEGETVEVAVSLERVIDTAGVQCGDFHIHTHRSNDSGDDATLKLRSAVADGVEIPVRSDHEYTATFQPLIESLGLTDHAFGIGSIEMTSFETWGHMGVVPLEPLPGEINAGAPRWQTYPTIDDPDAPVAALSPVEVFEAARARPEAPVVIINHPRGSSNYFDYVGFDPATGEVARPDDWDEAFTLVEVFNDSSWLESRDRTVRDWLSLLDHGRRVFAVGSSDSHSISNSPVGYPRTCLAVGTDLPSELTADTIRDALAAGHGTISGGVYVDARVGDAGPGDEATGLGEAAMVSVRVQAASWIDVDRIDVVVDGQTTQTIDILPDDADPLAPTTRFEREIMVDVASSGSYVIIAAYGDATLEPVHPRRSPFGVTNPIFLRR